MLCTFSLMLPLHGTLFVYWVFIEGGCTVLLPPKINQIQALTMLVRSMMWTSLLFAPLRFPPNSTAWWSSYLVKEKAAQGGGLVPVTLGEDHIPERNKRG